MKIKKKNQIDWKKKKTQNSNEKFAPFRKIYKEKNNWNDDVDREGKKYF